MSVRLTAFYSSNISRLWSQGGWVAQARPAKSRVQCPWASLPTKGHQLPWECKARLGGYAGLSIGIPKSWLFMWILHCFKCSQFIWTEVNHRSSQSKQGSERLGRLVPKPQALLLSFWEWPLYFSASWALTLSGSILYLLFHLGGMVESKEHKLWSQGMEVLLVLGFTKLWAQQRSLWSIP